MDKNGYEQYSRRNCFLIHGVKVKERKYWRSYYKNLRKKGKTVSITENLTKRRIIEIKIACETYGFKIFWSQDGIILFTDVNYRNKTKLLYD